MKQLPLYQFRSITRLQNLKERTRPSLPKLITSLYSEKESSTHLFEGKKPGRRNKV